MTHKAMTKAQLVIVLKIQKNIRSHRNVEERMGAKVEEELRARRKVAAAAKSVVDLVPRPDPHKSLPILAYHRPRRAEAGRSVRK